MTQKNNEAVQDACKKNFTGGKKQETNQLFKSVGSPNFVNLSSKNGAIHRVENNGSSLMDASKTSKMS